MLKELAGMPAGIPALEAVGTVTAADYERVFAPMVDRIGRAGGRMRLLYQFGAGFERITAGALWADTRPGLKYVRLLDGCAVVSYIRWIRAPSHAIGTWMPCPTQVYDDDAAAWLTSLPERAEETAKAFVGGIGAGAVSFGGLVVKSPAPEGHPRRG
ncbi:STAS/SEC14 domain-containing protein [Mycobacterium genavense]|uniref:STAS/SEC14 domain-containing protein n=1 Tax=Mycobacterium genavense TaxID=36812 RepID=UPI0004719174|nr:STAS/SEC14 domain-containing protein [Mycobacterium genavense]